ncbi:MAG: hypothetical protein AAB434_04980 [Planctomycetota bacterium]
MRNFMFLGLAIALMVAPALADGPAPQAGVVTTTDVKGHALHLTISGGIDIDSVWRDDSIVAVMEREGAIGRTFFDNSDSDSFFSPRVNLRFDAYMSDHVSAVIELNNERLFTDLESAVQPGNSLTTLGFGWGASAQASVFGGGYGINASTPVTIQQAYIQVDDFLFERFQMRFGVQDFVVDLRGNGNPFLIGFRPEGAEKAFISPIQESYSLDGSRYAYGPIAGAAGQGVYRSEEEAGGIRFTYSADEHLHFDVWTFNIWETGLDHYDEWFYGVMAKYNIPDSPSAIQFLVQNTSNDSDKNQTWTIGPGVDYWWDNLEIYGEFYYQFGDYGYSGALSDGGAISGVDGDIEQEAWAFYLGSRYNFDMSCSPWVDVQYAYISGDQGNHNDDDDENNDFVSYEDNDSLMILEDNLYGLDVDSNYWKVQLNTGVVLSLQNEKDLTISLTYAYAEIVSTPDRLDLPDFATASRSLAEPLGHETDVKFVWQYSDSLSFDLATAWLFDGEFWASGDNSGFVGAGGIDGDDHHRINDNMFIISVGATVRF